MTQDQLERLTREWQARLRLQDWDVAVKFVGHGEIDGFGQSQIGISHRTARILILHEQDLPSRAKTSMFPPETLTTETSLVHELLHIHFYDISPNIVAGSAEQRAQERAIEAIAQALVKVRNEVSG